MEAGKRPEIKVRLAGLAQLVIIPDPVGAMVKPHEPGKEAVVGTYEARVKPGVYAFTVAKIGYRAQTHQRPFKNRFPADLQ